ncbi:hypothetical protein ACQ4PT_058620 [Festuca glaucescens]
MTHKHAPLDSLNLAILRPVTRNIDTNAFPLIDPLSVASSDFDTLPFTLFLGSSNHIMKLLSPINQNFLLLIVNPSPPPQPHNQNLLSTMSVTMAEKEILPHPSNQKHPATPPPPGNILAKKSLLVGYSETTTHEGNGAGTSTVACVSDPGTASTGRRSGKELVRELGTEEEKRALVINMAQAPRANRGRFLAIGVFLSVIAITSKNLIVSMRKIIRTRVHLPIDRALQRWIPLIDEIENEEVVAFVHYERLPTFCYTCGFIGHKDTECMIAGNVRRKTYKADLGVMPIHPEDARKWFLPETTGQVRQAPVLP